MSTYFSRENPQDLNRYYSPDILIVGGGMAGICAAVAAARHGAKTVLIHDRPVLGGNASSEVRMWICGARGENNRETGILEEIALENLYRNTNPCYSVWDSVLYEKVRFQENLTSLLNCSCFDAETRDGRIISVTGWQMTTQQFHKVEAKLFADCSGDSILAPLTGADFILGYLLPLLPQSQYRDFFHHCLDCGIFISPNYRIPSIIPFGANEGDFARLKRNPFV